MSGENNEEKKSAKKKRNANLLWLMQKKID